MMDNFLTLAAAFDWITPTIAYLQDFLHGRVSDFGIPANAGWGRRDIRRLLKQQEIPVWGITLNLSGNMFMFTVPYTQAQLVADLLRCYNIPLLNAPAGVASSSPPAISPDYSPLS